MNGYQANKNSGVSVNTINNVLKGTSLAGHGQDFIDAGNAYGVDPAFLVAIVGAEQSFRNPYGSNNLVGLTKDLGFGDGRMFKANDNQALVGFGSVKDGLMAAAKNLSGNLYFGSGKTSVPAIAQTWVGKSGWSSEASIINSYLNKLGVGNGKSNSYYDRMAGKSSY